MARIVDTSIDDYEIGAVRTSISAMRVERLMQLLFVASGLAGLIYQSVWSHYLGLTLGHAAYAQALVLAIFMGGMAVGATWASRLTPSWNNLLLAYAVVEGVIGLVGLAFHPFFIKYLTFTQEALLPALRSASLATAWQWLSGAAILLPQSILLGATFPLLSSGVLRLLPRRDNHVLGGLYFSNSIGAAGGAIITTFLFLPKIGLPGAVMTAGGINLLVALGAAWVAIRRAPPARSVTAGKGEENSNSSSTPTPEKLRQLTRIMAVVTLLSGAFSFIYEVGWVRMLNQALGTTIHSFELMLAAFITGLAFGGLWIRGRAEGIDEIKYAGYAQVLMGVSAFFSLVVFAHSFDAVAWLMSGLARSDHGYTLYEIGSALIALLVMFPTAFFAGMTLPLYTAALLKAGAGEQVVGRIYAANTVGAIIGVFAVVHFLIPAVGVRLSVTIAAFGDTLLGLYLLRAVSPAKLTRGYAFALCASAIAAAVSLIAGAAEPINQASGVFRTGSLATSRDTKVEMIRDGKTATVSVFSHNGPYATIATNGKPDASLSLRMDAPPTADEGTMVEAAVIPLVLHPAAEKVAVIGWGSGLTINTVLGSTTPKLVDAIEIESAMYDGARYFGSRVKRAYTDQRVVLHLDDARTFFSTGARRYDLIISEPSNPWVSGVASLFTREFYSLATRHLSDNGLFVQWLQAYEINDYLLSTMIASLILEFPHVKLYMSNSSDLLFVASKKPVNAVDFGKLSASALQEEMGRLGIRTESDLNVRNVGSEKLLSVFVRLNQAVPHSDFYPVVSLEAPRSRFRGDASLAFLELSLAGAPVLEMIGERPAIDAASISADRISPIARSMETARNVKRAIVHDRASITSLKSSPQLISNISLLREMGSNGFDGDDIKIWSGALADVAENTLGALSAAEQKGVWISPVWLGDTTKFPKKAQEVLSAFGSAAARDPVGMRYAAVSALRDSKGVLAESCREQLLIIAQLGAIAMGDDVAVASLDQEIGTDIPSSRARFFTRAFLLSWADRAAGLRE